MTASPTRGEDGQLTVLIVVFALCLLIAIAVVTDISASFLRRQSLASGPTEIAFVQSVTVTLILGALIPIVGVPLPSAGDWPWILSAALLAITSLLILSWA